MPGLLDSIYPTAGMTPEQLGLLGARLETGVPNYLKGSAGEQLGRIPDLLQMLLQGAPNSAGGVANVANPNIPVSVNQSLQETPTPQVPMTSDRIAGLLGADPDDPLTTAGLLGVSPDIGDLARMGGKGLLAINMLAADSNAFRTMFKNSKLIDEAGNPQKLFHGSTGEIEKFDLSKANVESDWGAGVYLTSSVDDVNANYAGFGPDLTNRIELRAERLEHDFPDLDMDQLRKKAREQLSSVNEGQVTPLFAAVDNPVFVGGDNPTYLELEMVNPYYDSIEDAMTDPSLSGLEGDDLFSQAEDLFYDGQEEGGSLLDFIEALRENAGKYDDFDVDRTIGDILEASDYGPISAEDLQKTIKGSEGAMYATNDVGDLVSSEIVREAFEELGYDGVIDATVNDKFGTTSDMAKYGKNMQGVDENTVHVIVFDPEKLNTAFNISKRTGKDAGL